MTKKSNSDAAALALKVRENRLRRAASRQQLELVKARQRDSRGAIHGTYGLWNAGVDKWAYLGDPVLGFGLTLDEIEAWLNTPKSRRPSEALRRAG